jgi:hypothetical protein
VRHGAAHPYRGYSVSEALLVSGFVRSVVFVFLEVSFLAMVQLVRMVTLAFTLTLLVSFVLRIIRALFLEKWGRYGLYCASSETDTGRYRQNPGTEFSIHFHNVHLPPRNKHA